MPFGLWVLHLELESNPFVFNRVADSKGKKKDVITDFESGQDKIDLSDFAGVNKFSFIEDSAFSGVSGQLRFDGRILQLDKDGDGDADFAITFLGASTVEIFDLIL